MKDPEKTVRKQNEFYQRNRLRLLEDKKNNYPKTKDKKLKYNKEYGEKNKKELSQKRLIRERARSKSDPIYNIKKKLSLRIKRAFDSKGLKKTNRTWNILGTDREGLIKYFMETQGINILNKKETEGKEMDHICPLSQAQNEEELVKLNYYTNLQFLSKKENIAKSDKRTPESEIKCIELLKRDWINRGRN